MIRHTIKFFKSLLAPKDTTDSFTDSVITPVQPSTIPAPVEPMVQTPVEPAKVSKPKKAPAKTSKAAKNLVVEPVKSPKKSTTTRKPKTK